MQIRPNFLGVKFSGEPIYTTEYTEIETTEYSISDYCSKSLKNFFPRKIILRKSFNHELEIQHLLVT